MLQKVISCNIILGLQAAESHFEISVAPFIVPAQWQMLPIVVECLSVVSDGKMTFSCCKDINSTFLRGES